MYQIFQADGSAGRCIIKKEKFAHRIPRRQNSRSGAEFGFSLIEVLIASSVSIIAVIAIGGIFLSLGKMQSRANLLIQLSQIKLNFQKSIVKQLDWAATAQNNLSMACFQGSTQTPMTAPPGCTAIAGKTFMLYQASTGTASLIYDSTLPYTGYTTSGAPCLTFNGTNPDPAGCVLKPNLSFSIQCNLTADPTCSSPLVAVDLGYIYNGPNYGSIDFQTYGFHIVKPTYPLKITPPCTGCLPGTCGIPACGGSQQIVCLSSGWSCEDFGI